MTFKSIFAGSIPSRVRHLNHESLTLMDLLRYRWTEDDLNEPMPPVLQQYVERLYLEAWEGYIDAQCPFGKTEEGMLIWFEFCQQTTRN